MRLATLALVAFALLSAPAPAPASAKAQSGSVAPEGIEHLLGVYVRIDVVACGNATWWQLWNGGSCRGLAMQLVPVPPDNAVACTDPWQGQTLGSVGYTFQYNSAYDYSVARMRVIVSIPESAAMPLTPGSEYFAFRLRLSHQKAVGDAACTGCANAAAIFASQMLLGDNDRGDVPIDVGGPSTSWQAPGATACIPDPVRNRTWGAVKSLYR